MAAPVRADGFRLVACGALALCVAAEPGAAGAQDLAGPGAVHYTAGLKLADVYMFRGVRQNSTGIVAWPFADVGVRTLVHRRGCGEACRTERRLLEQPEYR